MATPAGPDVESLLGSIGMTLPDRGEVARHLSSSSDVYEALSKRYQVCATQIMLFGPQDERSACCLVQEKRCLVRDAVREAAAGIRDAAVLPHLEALRAALAAPAAKLADEAARCAADIAFLRGQAPEAAQDTWLAALLYNCVYIASHDVEAARAMVPRIAQVCGLPSADLVFDSGERRWTVRAPDGAEIRAPVPAAQRCARPGCAARGTKQCIACKAVRYCGKECQLAHWKLKPGGHKAACRASKS